MTLTTHPVSSMIVVSIIEGKNFPIRHDKLLLVEAKFDGEVMSTDPIAHNTFPYFNTELAWEVDKKSLQMHRLQRTVIKLVFYAADTEQTRKESIGYIVLDMRVAQENSQKPTWLPLLNCKYHKEKPEVLINLFLEKESGQGGFSGTRGNTYGGGKTYTVNDFKPEKKNFAFNSIPRLAQKTPDSSLPQSSNTLKPVLLPESSFYRIGPPELCQENFIFSITLAFAANLNKLGPPPVSFRTSKDFYFYYSLFENGITTGRFANLSNPDFLAERASVKIWSSTNLLSSYFEQHSNLELFLYCGDVRLALGHIPLGPLTSVNTHNINDEPISIDCSVQIYPIEKPCKFGNGELAPFVGICVVLQKVQELVTPDRPKVESREVVSNGAPVRRGNPFSRQTSVGSLHNGNEVNGNNIPHKDSSSVSSNNPRHTYTRAHSQEYEVSNERLNGTQTFTNSIHTLSRNTAAKVQFPTSTGGNGQTGNSTRNGNGQMASDLPDNVPHHFCFSLDLSNFRATRLEHPVNVFIRYSYPFFGSTSSILSQPEIEVMPGTEVNIPNGFCAFNFSATFSLMKNTFCESPLILEVVHCKKQGSRQEQLVGTARINLFQILDTGTRPQTVEGKQATRRMCTCKVSVMSLDGREVGDIYAVLTLDDFGPSTSFYDKGPSKAKTPVLTQLRNSMSSFDVPSMKPNGYTQDELFQAAFELEVWKERQREVFRAELKEKEMQHLKVLVSEWKQRDTEREVLLQSRVQDCRKLEDKLKQTLQDAEIKEKQLAAQENELILRVQNMDKQQEQQEKEMKLQLDKMKTEYNDLIRIERVNFLDLEEKNSTLQRKIRDLESEMQEQRAVIESLQTQLHKRPDIQLKTEVNILRMEKTELRQKLQAMCSSKEKYKHQYSQALGQVAFYQQKLLVMEQLDRNRKAEELAAIQQRLLNEDSPESQKDGQLSKKTEERVTSSPHNSSPHSQGDGNDQESPVSQSASEPAPTSSKSKENEAEDSTKCTAFMKHLINQKEMLLRTGFKEDDQIMQRFNLKLGETKLASS